MRVKRLIWSLLTRIGQRRNTYIYIYIYMIVVGTPQEKRQLRKPRPRWKYNSKVYLKEVTGNGAV